MSVMLTPGRNALGTREAGVGLEAGMRAGRAARSVRHMAGFFERSPAVRPFPVGEHPGRPWLPTAAGRKRLVGRRRRRLLAVG